MSKKIRVLVVEDHDIIGKIMVELIESTGCDVDIAKNGEKSLELYKENEELTNKLKLNYRRLLLFETENNRLLEEKNKLFLSTET